MLKLIEEEVLISKLQRLYRSEDDLRLAWTKGNWPFDPEQWKSWFVNTDEKATHSLYLYKETPEGSFTIGHGAILNYLQGASVAYLCFLIIDPQYRTQGYGRELVLKMCDYAKRTLNKKEIFLMVDPMNMPALNCYLSCGFSYVDGNNPRRYKKML